MVKAIYYSWISLPLNSSIDRQAGRQAGRQTDRQTDKQWLVNRKHPKLSLTTNVQTIQLVPSYSPGGVVAGGSVVGCGLVVTGDAGNEKNDQRFSR